MVKKENLLLKLIELVCYKFKELIFFFQKD